ncbi:Ion channel [Roseomonas rosea]|uniref:Ion channel n=1 Tax=Muricoccus roseus TaxID=198092 RepID=A0A1M6QSI1_9PROT|nr:potassium channel family protein [Roseomonas rosea]SHK23073.1 Ion channel [Roseomonas rosea]
MRPFLRDRSWRRPFLATMGLGALVAAGVGDHGLLFPLVVLASAALGFGLLFRLFPEGLDFALGTGVGFATYAALFTVVGRSAFPDTGAVVEGVAFLIPVLAFLWAVLRHRARLRYIVEGGEPPDEEHLRRIGQFMLMVAAIAVASLASPANRLGPEWQGVAMLAGSTLIGVLAARTVRELVRLLVDMAQVMDAIGARAVALMVPIATYAALFSLIAVVFACLFRIADGLSRTPLFAGPHGPIQLSFRDALHFSIVTLSTVGYGDIWPTDDGARLLGAVEVLAGQILLLFGFYEITRSRLSRKDEGNAADDSG